MKVLVGMSGGVDSSVTALILKNQGYEVVGVTFKLFDEHELLCNGESKCCSIDDVNDAKFVCDAIGIPHYVFNYKSIFQEKVVDYFAQSYIEGKTPNPCIACNRYIKFDAFIEKAVSMGFDYIATGHYAKVVFEKETGLYLLKKSVHKEKDQTYVLYNQNQYSLSKILMPLGDYTKDQIRQIASDNNLIVSKKPDSQDICFIPDGDYASFIKKYTSTDIDSGNFVDTNMNVIGKHNGYFNYTIGQRRGLGVGFGKRKYVVKIVPETNTVVIGDEKDLFTNIVRIKDTNFISGIPKENIFECTAKLRYSQNEEPVTVEVLDNNISILRFDNPQRAVTSGQSAVLYNGDIVIGGGEII